MANPEKHALSDAGARPLANTTKTLPQYQPITPRWLVRLLQWIPLEAGTYRVNRVKASASIDVTLGARDEARLAETFAQYEEQPQERTLSQISTVVNVNTRISDLFSSPHDQIREQLRLTVESVKESQEDALINDADYGLVAQVVKTQRISTRKGPPTPDDLDALVRKVWKEPAFFLAHPAAIEAFGRECSARGLLPPMVSLFGSPFMTWRGLPLVPSDKLPADRGKSSILLLRVGASKQGVVGLFQTMLPGEQTPGLSVRFMGVAGNGVASYLVSLYSSLAVHADDAVGLLENVELGHSP